MTHDPNHANLVQKLARYLRDHPQACDTPQGIARWWLGPDAVYDTASLEAALHALERHALIQPLRAADGRVRYRRTETGPDTDAKLDELAREGGMSSDIFRSLP
jgi:hypothetical protein